MQCGNEMALNGGPAHITVELDQGDEYTGGGSSARVRVCGVCAKDWIDKCLALVHRQFHANAEAQRAGR